MAVVYNHWTGLDWWTITGLLDSQVFFLSLSTGVWIQWNGMVDWNGMVKWNGTLVISIGGHLFIKTTF